jgi:hypothetical protein
MNRVNLAFMRPARSGGRCQKPAAKSTLKLAMPSSADSTECEHICQNLFRFFF